eukprot:SAG31_NODE_1183_length_9510_cov_43.257040_2_plen_65_part_00
MYLSIVLNAVNFCARLFSTGIDYGCTAVHVPVLVRLPGYPVLTKFSLNQQSLFRNHHRAVLTLA